MEYVNFIVTIQNKKKILKPQYFLFFHIKLCFIFLNEIIFVKYCQ